MTIDELKQKLIKFRNMTAQELAKINQIQPQPERYGGVIEGMDNMLLHIMVLQRQEEANEQPETSND